MTISLSGVNEYVLQNSSVPDNIDKVFVARADCHMNPNSDDISATIRLFFTKEKFLDLTSKVDHVATYKLD